MLPGTFSTNKELSSITDSKYAIISFNELSKTGSSINASEVYSSVFLDEKGKVKIF
jgi:hypothetical protein